MEPVQYIKENITHMVFKFRAGQVDWKITHQKQDLHSKMQNEDA